MYRFTLDMWKQGRIDEAYIAYQVEKGRLTQAEADAIMSLPQAEYTPL